MSFGFNIFLSCTPTTATTASTPRPHEINLIEMREIIKLTPSALQAGTTYKADTLKLYVVLFIQNIVKRDLNVLYWPTIAWN